MSTKKKTVYQHLREVCMEGDHVLEELDVDGDHLVESF